MLTQCGMRRTIGLALGTLALSGCVADPADERGIGRIEDVDVQATYRFDALTPTGEAVFREALAWMDEQDEHPSYPKPRMCARNASRVLDAAGLGDYAAEAVVNLAGNVAESGIEVLLPRDEAGMLRELNGLWGGRIPAGAIIAGCKRQSCWQAPGDAHAAIVGDVDDDGNILVYHNNWYRPENNGGRWADHMISREYYYDHGWRRQWMPTPWLRLVRDESGAIVDVVSVLPAIDDLDPRQYHLRIEVPREIALEIGEALETDGEGAVTPLELEPDPRLPELPEPAGEEVPAP